MAEWVKKFNATFYPPEPAPASERPLFDPKTWKAPDYRIYKVKGNPILEAHVDRLAHLGLKDPWIRNHAWKYQGGIERPFWQRLNHIGGRGFGIGFCLFVVGQLIQNAWEKNKHAKHEEDHGH